MENNEEVKLSTAKSAVMDALSKEELDAQIEKGYMDLVEGRTEPVEKVFADIRRDYGL